MESMLNREWRGAIVSVATDSTGVGFLRRKTNPFMERKENHMIIARAAKGAALLLMIFGVVALIGCQAAAGTKGDKGDKGDTGASGATGATGAQGPAGPSALAAKNSGEYSIVFNGTGDDTDQIGDLTEPDGGSLDLSDAFTGGTPPLTFKATGTRESGRIKVEVGENGMATVTKKENQNAFVTADFTTGFSFTVTATDANGVEVETQVTVMANRAPTLRTTHDPTGADTHLADTGLPGGSKQAIHVILGSQAKIAAAGNITEKAATNKVDSKGALVGASARRGYGVAGVGGSGGDGGEAMFEDDDPTNVKLSIGEISSPEHFEVEVDSTTRVLSFTGLKSTWDPDANDGNGQHKPETFELVATDPGGLTKSGKIWVWVDAVPALDPSKGTMSTTYRARVSEGDNTIINNLANFYGDPDSSGTLAVTGLTSSLENIATAAITSGNLVVTALNPGTVTITFAVGNSDPEDSAFHDSSVGVMGLNRDGDETVDGDDGDYTDTGPGAIPGAQYTVGEITVTVIP